MSPKGFTLIELVVVVVLIASAYALVMPSLRLPTKAFDFREIKSYLIERYPKEPSRIVCLEEDHVCFILVGKEKHPFPELNMPLKAYTLDKGYLKRATFFEPKFFKGHERISFSYGVDPLSGISDEMIVAYGDVIYYFPPLFGEVLLFESTHAFEEQYDQTLRLLKD